MQQKPSARPVMDVARPANISQPPAGPTTSPHVQEQPAETSSPMTAAETPLPPQPEEESPDPQAKPKQTTLEHKNGAPAGVIVTTLIVMMVLIGLAVAVYVSSNSS